MPFLKKTKHKLLLPSLLLITSIPKCKNSKSNPRSEKSQESGSAEYFWARMSLAQRQGASGEVTRHSLQGQLCLWPEWSITRTGDEASCSRPRVASLTHTLLNGRRVPRVLFAEYHSQDSSLPKSCSVFLSRLGSHKQSL